jgi:hypothetical protein
MTDRIAQCLTSLKQRLQQHDGIIQIQLEKGNLLDVTCRFGAGMPKSDIVEFFQSHNWRVPDDYLSFLHMHNGAELFCRPRYGGGLTLLDVHAIPLYRKDYDYMFPPECYPIGMLNEAFIYIHSTDVLHSPDQYLYWQSCIGTHDDALKLGMTFEVFLDLFIIAQGAEYWLWPTFKPPG